MNKPIKVLMVDDEIKFRAVTEELLNRRGFETIHADNGRQAVEKLGEEPDVVVMDIHMPGMDGHQALKEIKKQQPDLPVIMLTGHAEMPSAREALAEGAFDYLSKPCNLDILSARIVDAHQHRKNIGTADEDEKEKRIMDIMIPVEEYTVLNGEQPVKDAVEVLKKAFTSNISTECIIETGHRSVLVTDDDGNINGIMTIVDLIGSVMPPYLCSSSPSAQDSIQYSSIFWKGMFSKKAKELSEMKINEVMSAAPRMIDATTNLMAAAYTMLKNEVRRLLAVADGKVVGVIREQDLFFEIEKCLRSV
jgi:CheY-like chemotaxis protein